MFCRIHFLGFLQLVFDFSSYSYKYISRNSFKCCIQ